MVAGQAVWNRLREQRASRAMAPARLLLLSAVTICVVLSGWIYARRSARLSSFLNPSAEQLQDDQLDKLLQQVASTSLGDRRGAVIVMDPQSGRIRAIVNQRLAFGEAFRPGSTIKPFTTLAALRSGLIDEDSRTLCREKYFHEEFHTTCSHPRDLSPLNPTEAIAYSCNYYFGKLGERLPEPDFASTLVQFGFGKRTGLNDTSEAQGQLMRAAWRSQSAMGDGDYLQTTPIQLINAYAALVNGGRLFTPRISSPVGFIPELQASLTIKDEHRSLIVEGMRGAVRYGTAETANLYSVPLYIFGKTGTATEINGFRTQGWFVGFASPRDNGGNDVSEGASNDVNLAVLVFLARAHGSEAAQIARPIFEAYARSITERHGDAETRRHGEEGMASSESSPRLPVPVSPRPEIPNSPSLITVHLVRENITRQISLEDYVRGVVAAEGSMESEPEALKALAIASRAYALKNIGRHARDGYDFCTTTHCQRYLPEDSSSGRDISPAIAAAVESTSGEVLSDANHQTIDSYFSASCGGATANMTTLWGGTAPPYLRGVRDEYCTSEAHHSWTDVISQAQLQSALRSDPRTDVGTRLLSVVVSRRDVSGRAEFITIEGERRAVVKGWDFKIIVGRALGWNYLKSSRFEIARSGSNFVFRGQGFGHGLGLCQEGAHVMAARGASYRQILAKYFPGTTVSKQTDVGRRTTARTTADSKGRTVGDSSATLPPGSAERLRLSGELPNFFLGGSASPGRPRSRTFADLLWENTRRSESRNAGVSPRVLASISRRTLRSENFRINYPSNVNQHEVESLLSLLQSSRQTLMRRVVAAGITVRLPSLDIFINKSTGDFVGRTGQPAWSAAATRENRIELQPLETLKRRRVLETTLRHELVHAVADVLGRGRTPRWLAEGVAIYFAGEGQLVARYQPRARIPTEEIERKLSDAKSATEMRLAYAAAYGEVSRLIKAEGEASVWRRVVQ